MSHRLTSTNTAKLLEAMALINNNNTETTELKSQKKKCTDEIFATDYQLKSDIEFLTTEATKKKSILQQQIDTIDLEILDKEKERPQLIERATAICSPLNIELSFDDEETQQLNPSNNEDDTQTKRKYTKSTICKHCGIPGHTQTRSVLCQKNHLNLAINSILSNEDLPVFSNKEYMTPSESNESTCRKYTKSNICKNCKKPGHTQVRSVLCEKNPLNLNRESKRVLEHSINTPFSTTTQNQQSSYLRTTTPTNNKPKKLKNKRLISNFIKIETESDFRC
jgi:hypothetical protein